MVFFLRPFLPLESLLFLYGVNINVVNSFEVEFTYLPTAMIAV